MAEPKRRVRDMVIDRLEITDDFTINGRTVPSLLARGATLCVDTTNGADTNGGHNWDDAFQTMGAALTAAQSYDTILLSGDVREELTGSHEKFDITIVGMGTRPRHANTGYAGASVWRPPASPTAATPLLKVRAQGWQFHNILFDCPVDAAGVYLERNAIDGVASGEYDASHAGFYNCRFESGLIGIQNHGGCGFVEVDNCRFYRMSGSGAAGIKCTSTGTAVPLNWQIRNSHFANNASHILSSMSYSEISGNTFGRFTATLSIDLYNQPSSSQGEYNIITGNYLPGAYGVTAYPAGSNNEWAGNQNVAGVTTADPS
jgi:hypothetical protein